MSAIVYILFILLGHILGCEAGDFCYQYLTYSFSYGLEYFSYYGYCDDGCCGSTVTRTCCQNKSNTGMIVGIVVGIFLFFLCLAIIVVCIYKNSKPLSFQDNDIEDSHSQCNSEIDLGPMYGEDGDQPFHIPPNQTESGPPYGVTGYDNLAITVEASMSPPPAYTDAEKY
ncbi:uncharacterized protein LOC110460497 [Mizuhopecten yessoensis]|uniref:uncharacterized protein LOC110460497 n=1 Tax=Mizuhopecten yessoensis TaxID=6573 RepID=UPI000B45AD9A|nr:uncharacterized protein LOC110460497 [Mizuhopecten yessoensis]